MNDGVYRYPYDDSAYVSPTSLFNDNRKASNGLDLGSLKYKDSGPFDVAMSLSYSSPSSSTACNCVQNHADLLFSLKDLEQRHTSPRLDVLLFAAQQALVSWKDVIECRVCLYDDSQQVLMLSGRGSFGDIVPLCNH